MSDPAGSLELRRIGTVLLARLDGEIDLSDAPGFEEQIAVAMTGAPALVVDLSAVTFFDSSGVRMLFDLLGDCEHDRRAMAVVAPEGGAARVILRVCAFGEDRIRESLEETLALLEG